MALRFEREESPDQKRRKLEGFLVQYGLPLAEAVTLFDALLSLPLGDDNASLALTPEQQKQKTPAWTPDDTATDRQEAMQGLLLLLLGGKDSGA